VSQVEKIEKINAARKAVELINDGMTIGLGSGSTVELFVKELGKRVTEEGIELYVIPSSYQSHILAVQNGLIVTDLFQVDEPDICVDGADQVDRDFNLIKGGGAALTREKIVASASKEFYVIVNSSKIVEKLSMPVPVEILPFAFGYVKRRIAELGGMCMLREGTGKLKPVISDNGNFIADCSFESIDTELVWKLNSIPGLIEHGIFLSEMVDAVIVGYSEGVKVLRK
jgi:ribose 5-phosphate isomerase A